jgi:hypothetical protein
LDTSSDDESESTDSDSQGDDNDNDNHDHDLANEPLPTAQGTKRPFDVTFEDAMVLPKIKKNTDGQRMKANDFDDISKEILVTASSIFRCLIVTQAPFPGSIAAETRLAKEAWHEACQIKGVNVKLTPSVVKMVSNLFSVRSWPDLYYTL